MSASPPPTAASTPPRPAPTGSGAPSRSGWGGLIFWSLLLIGGGAGWWTRAEWWPRVAPYVEPYLHRAEAKGGRPARAITVGTGVVRQRDVELVLNGLGTVTAYQTVTVRSRVEGELTRIAFEEGQVVTAGDLLAEIDPRTWQAQLDQAQAQLTRDQATLKAQVQTLDRYRKLTETNIISPQQVDDQDALVKQTEAAIKSDLAAIANAKLQLDYCRITAPVSGRIGLRLVDSGNIVGANDPTGIAVITQLQPIAVLFTIPQDDIARVQRQVRGSPTALVVEAFDRDFRQKLAEGTLVALDNQVDSTTGTVRLKAQFPNTEELLFPNQFVNVRLKVEREEDVLVVPTAAIQRGPETPFVYVVENGETVTLRPVEPGPIDQQDTVIRSGLSLGEVVVTEGVDRLQPGAKVVLKDKAGKERKGKPGADSTKPSPGATEGPPPSAPVAEPTTPAAEKPQQVTASQPEKPSDPAAGTKGE